MIVSTRRRFGTHAVLAPVSAATVFPVVWAIATSFKPANDLHGLRPWSDSPTLDAYREALQTFPLMRLLTNTALMAVGVTFGQVIASILAAYAFSRYRFRGRGVAFAAIVGTILVPQQALIIPHYLLAAELGILGTYIGLVLPQIATCAVGVLLLDQHMRALPEALFDSASLDGATDWEILWRIVLPNLRPAIAALSVVFFIGSWNEYVWPLLAAREPDMATVQVGLQAFQTEEGTAWHRLMAAASMASLPVLVVYMIAQRQILDAVLRAGLR